MSSPAALRGVRPHAIFIARNRPIKFALIERSRTTKLTHGQTHTGPGHSYTPHVSCPLVFGERFLKTDEKSSQDHAAGPGKLNTDIPITDVTVDLQQGKHFAPAQGEFVVSVHQADAVSGLQRQISVLVGVDVSLPASCPTSISVGVKKGAKKETLPTNTDEVMLMPVAVIIVDEVLAPHSQVE